MDRIKRKHQGQIEINDLVAEAISNAAARRHQIIDADEQAADVKGGLSQIKPPIVLGIIINPPSCL